MKYRKYVPIGDCLIKPEDGSPGQLQIAEVLDKKHNIVKWAFVDKWAEEKCGRAYFNVGELFLDFVNFSVALDRRKKEMNAVDRAKYSIHETLFGSTKENVSYFFDKLTSTNFDDKKELFEDCLEMCDLLDWDNSASILPFGDGKPVGRKYIISDLDKRDLQNAFLMHDLFALIQNDSIQVERCKHCGALFISHTKNQRYCPECVDNKIPSKNKAKKTDLALRKKIYSRLAARGNDEINYGVITCNAFTFSNEAQALKASSSEEEYFDWLNKIDKATKTKPSV